MNSDHVLIKSMQAHCRIGTSTEERAFPQVITISVKMFLPLKRAGETDSLDHTIDYAETIKNIRTRLLERTYVLAETVAADIADIALSSQFCEAAEVEINKKVFEGIEAVGVFIRREKKSY